MVCRINITNYVQTRADKLFTDLAINYGNQ